MANRARVSDVMTVLPSHTQLDDKQVKAAIDAANCVVDDILLAAPNFTDGKLLQIEIYMSAHFAAVTENTLTLKSEKDACSGASATYGFTFGVGVMGTPFGIMANTLSNGIAAELDKPQASMFSIGSH